ncbi:hypothetical protein [Xylanimonas protaetiae]|uniref:Uncharacterized protein n=1 Tax=Xylanimonas protaetiae TaxID=2509457 RepID=A0A4P6F3P6_9MICO|nr:hypothetical protein [Xylanimonas protaetiae]QAY69865.1 hypothetical protein ET471_07300 [Xylanimonas protaetiae]
MKNRTLSRISAAALAGLLAVVPVGGAVAAAPAAAADVAAVVAVAVAETEPVPGEVDAEPAAEDTGIVPGGDGVGEDVESEDEADFAGSLLLVGIVAFSSLVSIGVAGFLLFRRPPVRNQAT